MSQRTLAIIKPDAVRRKLIGEIITAITQAGFHIVGLKLVHMTKEQAESFYDVHRGRFFFEELTRFMSSGPVVVMVLQKEQAVEDFRSLIGATDPTEAAAGTIRHRFGTSKGENAIHGSDSLESAEREIAFFFSSIELVDHAP
ncbi:MAG: nucleoside-diphosphate kinase [Candidatus Kapabacteria bacterium]|nr:nucleoside-diphosphate kinase [Candidatus Kapabacteria bacterium]MCS7169004.1 nucleoside-diphosphate kinase [Candidatus Kapabacteria bacterium]MDW7997259.1 nucleoside-diphosphate kinase [Bacteroidota bacterium]MDW8224762.1 nucleoside-diphosphate kinase [Bacteroidota bacterium]